LANNKIVIIGATSLIAKHCARIWAEQAPAEMVLAGRDPHKIKLLAKDLNVRSPDTHIDSQVINFREPDSIAAFARAVCSQRLPDIVLIAHGFLSDQEKCQHDLTEASEAMYLNGISPALFAEAFAHCMEKGNRGTIAIIGSVAGDRGRKSNYNYGSAKGLLSRYVQGMQHRFAGTGIKVIQIKPGPTDTPMTALLKTSGMKLAPVDSVARDIVSGIAKGKALVYTPSKWFLIMMIVRHIPGFIFNKTNI